MSPGRYQIQVGWWFVAAMSAPEWLQPDLRSWIHLIWMICHMLPQQISCNKDTSCNLPTISYMSHHQTNIKSKSWHFKSKHSQSHRSPRNRLNNGCWPASSKAIKDFRELSFRGTAQSSTKIKVPTNSNTSFLADFKAGKEQKDPVAL